MRLLYLHGKELLLKVKFKKKFYLLCVVQGKICLEKSGVVSGKWQPRAQSACRKRFCIVLQICDGFPFFMEMQWYALNCYVSTLSKYDEHRSQTTAELVQLRKAVAGKRLKVETEGGDSKSQKVPNDPSDNGDNDTAANDRNEEAEEHPDRCYSQSIKFLIRTTRFIYIAPQLPHMLPQRCCHRRESPRTV